MDIVTINNLIPIVKKSLPYIVLILLSTLLYQNTYKNKPPLIVDSNFYLNSYYQYQGLSFEDAKYKVFETFNLNWKESVQQNMLYNPENYEKSFTFFSKRPLYPFVSAKINQFLNNDLISLYLPPFLSLFGISLIFYYFAKQVVPELFSLLVVSLYLIFTRLVEWSTFFVTDVIGAFFWLSQLFVIHKYAVSNNRIYLAVYIFLLAVSILNREQSLLMVFTTLSFFLFTKNSKKKNNLTLALLAATTFVLFSYLILSYFLRLPTVYDNLLFLESRFGLYEQNQSVSEVFNFYQNALFNSHIALFAEMLQKPLEGFILLGGIFGIYKTIKSKSLNLTDKLMLASAVGSYASLFISPFYSIRFIFPVQITFAYFLGRYAYNFMRKFK